MKTIYLAESWFTPAQVNLKTAAETALQQNPTVDWPHSFRPAEHRYRDWDTQADHTLAARPEWQLGTFNADVQGINGADLVVALLEPTPANTDPGVVWEMGYAYGCHKPVVLVVPAGDQPPLNLMPAVGATTHVTVAELATYDFAQVRYTPYIGQIF